MRKILVVDDDFAFATTISVILKNEVTQVITAYNVAGAKKAVEDHQNEIVLVCTDLEMPDGTGFDLLAFVKESRLDIPVVIISGRNDPRYEKKALELGVIEYIDKSSIRLNDFRLKISSLLGE
ncbi:response regulator [Anaerostipes hominis (ex Lee et al. 2021)]|jgi:two-component system response regulator YesN|uniref:response regulator n=1 Tax=Anaerostipes hominis (ex Lee et al. 2021) TaxID=2025494 RepID=UPI0022DFA0CF|nr:response regulator [Anaerostipes hominis (ex Lee et al. 2021)]